MKEQIISFNFHNSFTQEYRCEPWFIDEALTRAMSLRLPIEKGRAGVQATLPLASCSRSRSDPICVFQCSLPACITAAAGKVLPKTAGAGPAHSLVVSQAWWSCRGAMKGGTKLSPLLVGNSQYPGSTRSEPGKHLPFRGQSGSINM